MKHFTHRHLPALAALIAALFLAPSTLAQPSEQPAGSAHTGGAAKHAEAAKVAYDLQDWATAEREYQAAYRLEQKPEHLWGLAQVQRLSGQYTAAIKSYRAFQRSGVSSSQANAAEMMVMKSEAELAKEEARQAAESREQADAAPEDQTAPAPAAPESSGADSADDSWGLHPAWFITAAVVTVAVGAVAIWSGIDTMDKSSAYEAAPTQEAYNDGTKLETRTNFLVGATVVAGVGTAIFAFVTDWSGGSDGPVELDTVSFGPAVGPEGGALVVTGRF